MVTASARTPQTDQAAKANALAALTEQPGEQDLRSQLLDSGDASPDAPASAPARTTLVPFARGGNVQVLAKGGFFAVSDGAVEGQFDQTDTRHPTLKIVQGSGPLKQRFAEGTIILGDEELMPPWPKDPVKAAAVAPLRFFPIQLKKQFQEILPDGAFEQNIMPKIVDTIEEVEALGGTIQYIEGATNRWRPSGRILMLIEKPENCEHPLFSIELDKRVFAPAVYFAAGGSYGSTVKAIWSNKSSLFQTDSDGVRKIRLWRCAWTFRPNQVKAGNFLVFRPEVRMILKDQSGPELHAFAKELITGAPEAADGGE